MDRGEKGSEKKNFTPKRALSEYLILYIRKKEGKKRLEIC